MEHVFRSECGYVDHPRDPGGATNRGITIGTLSDHLGRPATKAEVRALSKKTARDLPGQRLGAEDKSIPPQNWRRRVSGIGNGGMIVEATLGSVFGAPEAMPR